MPTARELLEQADALMRRNRGREFEADIPELTDEVAVAAAHPAVRESPTPSRAPPPLFEPEDDDVPELVDAVEELSIQPLPDDDDEVSRWLEVDLGESSVTGPAPEAKAGHGFVPLDMLALVLRHLELSDCSLGEFHSDDSRLPWSVSHSAF